MNRKYEYATDKIYNLRGNEGNKYRANAINGNHSKCRMTPKYLPPLITTLLDM